MTDEDHRKKLKEGSQFADAIAKMIVETLHPAERTGVAGFRKDYQKMYAAISGWNAWPQGQDCGPLYSVGYSMSEAGYFGHDLSRERRILKRVEDAHRLLCAALSDAIGKQDGR